VVRSHHLVVDLRTLSSTTLRMASSGSERTADELGRAFPNTRVILADGDHPVISVDARPALVVATRGAEPHADGGYHAVILLDGDRMLLAEQLRIGESALRWWSNAAALARPGALCISWV
jgi:primosomal protein N' (replication factor Y)